MKKGRKRARPKVKAAKPARRGTKRESVLVPDPSAPAECEIEVEVPSPGTGRGARSERAATAAEAASQVKTLDRYGRISRTPGALGPGQTHTLETGRGGRRKLVRKRFSAS